MSEPPPRIELPPEAEPARDFIEALVGRYEKRIRELEQQVQSLTEQLQKLTPRNSSLPPSTEHAHAKPDRKKRPGKKRNRGGQSGHKRQQRALVPVEACTTVTALHPSGNWAAYMSTATSMSVAAILEAVSDCWVIQRTVP